MKNGISVTEEMAEAINNTPEQKFQVLKQQIHNNVEELGNGLLPAVNNTMDKVRDWTVYGKWWRNNTKDCAPSRRIPCRTTLFVATAGSERYAGD